MFSEIDSIIFPDSCEVIQLTSQHFVYPIMKNGSSSFYYQMQIGKQPDWKIIQKHNLNSIKEPLIVFLRNPQERFISGVNTYLQHLDRDNLNLDHSTVMWFVDNYLFLNRHYCPQFFWLVNLARFAGTNVQLQLEPMTSISKYANLNHRAGIALPTEQLLNDINKFNWKKLELYFYLDQIVLNMVNRTVTFEQIVDAVCDIPVLNELINKKPAGIMSLVKR